MERAFEGFFGKRIRARTLGKMNHIDLRLREKSGWVFVKEHQAGAGGQQVVDVDGELQTFTRTSPVSSFCIRPRFCFSKATRYSSQIPSSSSAACSNIPNRFWTASDGTRTFKFRNPFDPARGSYQPLQEKSVLNPTRTSSFESGC